MSTECLRIQVCNAIPLPLFRSVFPPIEIESLHRQCYRSMNNSRDGYKKNIRFALMVIIRRVSIRGYHWRDRFKRWIKLYIRVECVVRTRGEGAAARPFFNCSRYARYRGGRRRGISLCFEPLMSAIPFISSGKWLVKPWRQIGED